MGKQGNLIETKFKMKAGKQDLYTLNMYHTKITCLVNGRQSKQFLRDDLPKIIRSVELNLQQNSVTAAEINKRFQNILLSCASAVLDSQDNLNDEHEHQLKTLSSAVRNVREIRQVQHKENNSQSVTKYDCEQNQNTENSEVIIVKKVEGNRPEL